MRWRKLGPLVIPDANRWWMSHYAGPSFVQSSGQSLKIFVTGRDQKNESRIGLVTTSLAKDCWSNVEVANEPLLDVGEPGTFDESGVSYPWLIDGGSVTLMFYVGWVAGGKTRFQNFLGLAESADGGRTWRKTSRAPLMDRTDKEPFGTGSCCVWRRDTGFTMLYTSFCGWWWDGVRAQPKYLLRLAVSDDGRAWTRTHEPAVTFRDRSETVIGKPSVLIRDDGIHLWYSMRGAAYRIGYAVSRDGLHFTRRDDLVGIDASESGWDSQMIEYAHVFEASGDTYMVYNGNGFGRTGLGLAVLEGNLGNV